MPPMDRSKWKRVRFGDVVRCVDKSCRDPQAEGLTRVVGLEHLDPGELKITRWADVADGTSFTRTFRAGQVLFGKRRAYQRKAAVADFDGICSGDILVFEADSSQFSPALLPFVVASSSFFDHAIGTSAGSLSPRTKWKELAEYEFLVPSFADQHRIAALLWSIEDCRYKVVQAIASLAMVRKLILLSKFRGHSYKSVPLGDVFEVQLGKMLSPKARQVADQYPYLTNTNIQWGHLDLHDVRTMHFDERERDKFKLQKGDLLVCEGGEVGRAAIWNGELADCYYQKALHRLRPRSDCYLNEFLLELLKFFAQSGDLSKLTGHSTIAHLTAEKLRQLRIPNVPVAEQAEIVRLVTLLDNQTQQLVDHTDYLQRVRGAIFSWVCG